MAKNIILCSDGTGNKGGYGADTNVYKLYRSVDIHNNKKPQITFYDNGVGTNIEGEALKQNKFWRAVSGAFGFGFENNVRDLYEFLVLNYQLGDQVYLFGFSRGASTVRAFSGLVHTCGLLNKNDAQGKLKPRAMIQKQINQAILAYRVWRKEPSVADNYKKEYAIKNASYAPAGDLKIRFIGVWDTVSALGFPQDWSLLFDKFFSLMDKLSEQKWPHHYYNFRLNENIGFACQALAIDDERTTFFPKIWREQGRSDDTVEQVWFAGVHSNVGGGYPRTGLSNVTLEWMMAHAQKQGLVFIEDTLKDAGDYANVQGKLYNSRDGFAVYYRYQPRDIQAICGQRLNGQVKIHETAMERLKQGTAAYAPGYLPCEFEIVDTSGRSTIAVKQNKDIYRQNREEVDAPVNKLQWLYRIFVESTVILFAIVLLFWANPPDSISPYLGTEGTEGVFFLFAWIHTVLTYILPAIFENFLTYILCVQPWIFVGMVAVIYGMNTFRRKYHIQLNRALAKTREQVLSHLP